MLSILLVLSMIEQEVALEHDTHSATAQLLRVRYRIVEQLVTRAAQTDSSNINFQA